MSGARIFKRLWGPGIDSKELIPPAYVAGRYDKPIPPRFLNGVKNGGSRPFSGLDRQTEGIEWFIEGRAF